MSMAGESAQREYERRRETRRAAIATQWPLGLLLVVVTFFAGAYGPGLLISTVLSPLGASTEVEPVWLIGLLLAVGAAFRVLAPAQSEIAWRRGADGERAVARALESIDDPGAVFLHDRRTPGSRANIDHLAVTSRGVFTIDAKNYQGKLEVRRGSSQLWVAGRNRSKLLDQAERQQAVTRRVLAEAGLADVRVTPALCFVGTELPLLFRPRRARDILLTAPRKLQKDLLDGRERVLSAAQVMTVASALQTALRPAGAAAPSSRTPAVATPSVEIAIDPRAKASACSCGAPMVERRRRRDGQPFLGCSTFPQCRQTRPLPSS